MKANELRIGNLIEYKIEDELDERKEWWEVSKVDFQDLTWLDSNPEDSDFRPIKLTEEWLLKFWFKYREFLNDFFIKIDNENILIIEKEVIGFSMFKCEPNQRKYFLTKIYYVHQLQNLFFSLCGEELTQVSEGENKNFV